MEALLRLFLVASLVLPSSACQALKTPVPSNDQPPAAQPVLVWSYTDDWRLGLEIRVRDYPLPAGFETRCPFTRVELLQNGRAFPLYRNPEQIGLDEFYDLTRQRRWYCFQERRGTEHADYLLSLTFFDKPLHFVSHPQITLYVELGEVIATATDQSAVITLPAQGKTTLSFSPGAHHSLLTWGQSAPVQSAGLTATVERVFINPSVTWLDACLEYTDHHTWQPTARLDVGDQTARSVEWWLLFPFNPEHAETILQSTRRCFGFIIPFAYESSSLSTLRIGIEQVQIERADSYTLSLPECEAAAQQVERDYPGTKIRCREFFIGGKRHGWFEVVEHAPGITSEEGYQAMLSVLTLTLSEGWYWQIRP